MHSDLVPTLLLLAVPPAGCSSSPAETDPAGVTEALEMDVTPQGQDGSGTGSASDDSAGPREQVVSFDAGAIDLFNDRDLAGWNAQWQGVNRDKRAWQYDAEGNLVCQGKAVGYLQTDEAYSDFLLELDWRYNPRTRYAAQGGVLVRITGKQSRAQIWPRCIEVDIRENYTGDLQSLFGMGWRSVRGRTGDNITRKMAKAESRRGDWNHFEIRMERDVLTVKLNGTLVNEITGVEQVAGPIGLKSEMGEIQYRNATLTPLPLP